MKGLFIPDITAEMFRNGCLESIEALMAEGEIYDIEYEPERKKGQWIDDEKHNAEHGCYFANCSECGYQMDVHENRGYYNFCPNCGADMR